MKDKKQETMKGRRDFLRGGAIAGAGVAVASSIPSVALAANGEAEVAEKQAEKGYRLTRHVLDYYKSAAE
ncbi:MAG TPA: twin-arginine translocation signal domain-containing protein [Gammaproteobacteria bacterium]|jgi:hypothetical protein